MPTPMRMDDAVRLCGGNSGDSIRARLVKKFAELQVGGRPGTWVDQERRYLVWMLGYSGGSRYDMWKAYLDSGNRPFTDGMDSAASLTARSTAYTFWGLGSMLAGYGCSVEGALGSGYLRSLKRSYTGFAPGGAVVGGSDVVVA